MGRSKAPKIQRLITPVRLQRKRSQKAAARSREEASKEAEAAYRKLQATRSKLLQPRKTPTDPEGSLKAAPSKFSIRNKFKGSCYQQTSKMTKLTDDKRLVFCF